MGKVAVLGGVLVITGCVTGAAGGQGDPVQAAELYASAQCGQTTTEPSLTWLDNETEFEQRYRSLVAGQSGQEGKPRPQVDFSEAGVLLIAMGRQPTPGYAVELADQQVTVQRDTATVRVRWVEPPPGRLLAQVLTHPCTLVKVQRQHYQRIRIVDQDGRVRATTVVAPP